MHAQICAGCGAPVGPHHVDAEELTGIKLTHDVSVTERSHNLGLLQEKRTTVTYSWQRPVRHRFTICEACVRGVARGRVQERLARMEPPRAKTGSLVGSLLIPTAILGGVTFFVWDSDTSWLRWVLLGAIPAWWALTIVGDRSMDKDAVENARATAEGERELAALAQAPWDQVQALAGDLSFLRASIVRTRRRLDDCQVIPSLDHHAIDPAACPTDVIEVGVPHDPVALAARLQAAGIKPTV